jgi:hypothetical protein
MDDSLLRRIRWENVARAAAALAVVVLGVAWLTRGDDGADAGSPPAVVPPAVPVRTAVARSATPPVRATATVPVKHRAHRAAARRVHHRVMARPRVARRASPPQSAHVVAAPASPPPVVSSPAPAPAPAYVDPSPSSAAPTPAPDPGPHAEFTP